MNRRSLLVRVGMIGAAVAGGWWLKDHVLWRAPDLTFDPAGGWLPWASRRLTLPTVEARIGDRTVQALIDSGAQYSVIDRGLFAELGRPRTFDMPLVAYGVGGGAQLGKGVTLDIGVGATRIANLRAAILDLGPLARADGLATPLILGQDVLGQTLLDLDVAARRLRFAPSGTPPPANVVEVPVRRTGRALGATITVEETTLEAVVDTGSSGLLALSRSAAEGAGLLDGREARRGSSLVLGGAVAATLVEVGAVTFAGHRYERVETGIFDDVPVPGFPAALIGMGAFEDRRAILDLGGGRLMVSRPLELTVGA